MASIESSNLLLSVENLKVHFELEHFQHKSVREVFVSMVGHPIKHFFRTKEILPVIDGISFELRRGTRLGIIGINGCGKTTLCRCIAGMMRPTSGKILSTAEIRAIFDTSTGVIGELTGKENAFLLARLFFPKIKDLKPIVEEALEFSELGHFVDIPFNRYSKGMQSRLLLSLISSIPTDLLILDEVFDGADVFFQQKLADRMKNFIERAGATIFVSHTYEQISKVCNEVMILKDGKIHFRGDPKLGWEEYLKLNQ